MGGEAETYYGVVDYLPSSNSSDDTVLAILEDQNLVDKHSSYKWIKECLINSQLYYPYIKIYIYLLIKLINKNLYVLLFKLNKPFQLKHTQTI